MPFILPYALLGFQCGEHEGLKPTVPYLFHPTHSCRTSTMPLHSVGLPMKCLFGGCLVCSQRGLKPSPHPSVPKFFCRAYRLRAFIWPRYLLWSLPDRVLGQDLRLTHRILECSRQSSFVLILGPSLSPDSAHTPSPN